MACVLRPEPRLAWPGPPSRRARRPRPGMYAHVYDNKLEVNSPMPICGPCTCDDKCVNDRITVYPYDRLPTRVGMCWWCIPVSPGSPPFRQYRDSCHLPPPVTPSARPCLYDVCSPHERAAQCTCCGPPVIYAKDERACCGIISLEPCFGVRIKAAPNNMCGLKARQPLSFRPPAPALPLSSRRTQARAPPALRVRCTRIACHSVGAAVLGGPYIFAPTAPALGPSHRDAAASARRATSRPARCCSTP